MSSELYKKENNLFQSLEWQVFQENYGRQVEKVGEFNGLKLGLPLGQSFIWFQKAPQKVSSTFLDEVKKLSTTFVRLEPGEAKEQEIKKYSLRPVTKKSLLSGQASPKATRVLDLNLSEDELLSQMKPKTRYNIRLAEKKGLKISESTDVDKFYQILLATSGKKTGYFPHEKEYYQNLLNLLGPTGMAKIYLAEYQGEPLAAIMVTFYGKTATYLHGGQSNVQKNLMAPYLCQWSAICESKKRGCLHYDFWGVAETDDPSDPWAGISRFKDGFGGEKVVFPGTYDLVLRPFWYNILTLMAKLRHLGR